MHHECCAAVPEQVRIDTVSDAEAIEKPSQQTPDAGVSKLGSFTLVIIANP